MMTGTVNARREATLPLQVLGPNGQQQEITAVIDTGYNGTMALPMAVITALALPFDATRRVTLGDRSQRLLDFYNGEIFWDGHRRAVLVLAVEGDPLIGTAALQGCHLGVDFEEDGNVTVTSL